MRSLSIGAGRLLAIITLGCFPLMAVEVAVPLSDAAKPTTAGEETSDPAAADLRAMQGRWTMTTQNPFGATIQKEMIVHGDVYTLTERDPRGNVYLAVRSTITLKHEGAVRIATYSNIECIAGANFGERRLLQASCVYRIYDDHMCQVFGVLKGDDCPFSANVWARAN